MTVAVDRLLNRTFSRPFWLLPTDAIRNGIAFLPEALGPAWCVSQEIDCDGEISVIVLSTVDEAKPVLILYEKDGVTRVATVADDNWEGDQGFASFQTAISWIIMEASRLSTGAQAVT